MTRKEKVLEYLTAAQTDRQWENGWVDGYVLCHPNIGGSEGLRRLRELREDGVRIDQRPHPRRGSSTNQYRITPDTNRLFT